LSAAPAAAMSTTKRLLHQLRGRSLPEGVAIGAEANARARMTEEFRRTVLRFAGK
jgi:hypothetical protein